MAGTKAGAAKAIKTIRERYGEDFHQKIGRLGGRSGHTGGFYANRELASRAGAIGGRISRRGQQGRHGYTDVATGKWRAYDDDCLDSRLRGNDTEGSGNDREGSRYDEYNDGVSNG